MSYDCDNCGKNQVEHYGEWCPECQEREFDYQIKYEAEWFAKSKLCQKCSNVDGNDRCIAYDMPLFMVARKKKCKKFKSYNIKIIW